ncbi:MAG: DUF599 domain-containing protein [Proteobacteria bacterium]|nr:DUF599 domain-containing protein [Pseudomonadota bacterium]
MKGFDGSLEWWDAISALDIIALIFFVACWAGYAHYTERHSKSESLLSVTNRYRRQWMREMVRRDNRTTDTILIGNLQRSISFFANTSIFIIIGLITMLGYEDKSHQIIGNIPFARETSTFMWQMKIFLLMIIFTYSFFKYTWSTRQFNYASIFVNAIPPYPEVKDQLEDIAAKGSYLAGNAAKHFNSGLRSYYFGLAALAWFVHPLAFMLATALVVYVTHRREYHSTTLANLAK